MPVRSMRQGGCRRPAHAGHAMPALAVHLDCPRSGPERWPAGPAV